MKKYIFLAGTTLMILLNGCVQKSDENRIKTPTQAIEALIDGNRRFVSGKPITPNRDKNRLKQIVDGQKPFAAIVSCSDSRVPVELLFDQGFGDLFVVRNAGNTVSDEISQGSIDYAVNHLDVKVVVVLAHTSCGAISGAVSEPDSHGETTDDGVVPILLKKVGEGISEYIGKTDCITEAAKENARVQVTKMTQASNIKSRIDKGELMLAPAIYDITNNQVHFFESLTL